MLQRALIKTVSRVLKSLTLSALPEELQKIIARDRIDVELYFTNFISKEDFIPRDYDNVFLHIEHFYFGMLPGQDTALSISPLDDGISIKYRFKAK